MDKQSNVVMDTSTKQAGNHEELLERRASFMAQQKLEKAPKLSVKTQVADASQISSPTSLPTPISPTKKAMHGLDTELMTIDEATKLLLLTEVEVSKISKKQTDSGTYSRIIQDIVRGFTSRKNDIAQILDACNSNSTTELQNMQIVFFDFYKNVWCMKEYLQKISSGYFKNTSSKRRKVLDQAYEVQRAWTNLVSIIQIIFDVEILNLAYILAKSSSEESRFAKSHVDKLAAASGVSDFDSISSEDPRTFYIQGEKYLLGLGVEQNYTIAFERYHSAALLNVMEACHMVATLYDLGLGVQKNFEKALEWYTKASDLGSFEATNSIGLMYENDEIHKDMELSRDYYKKSVALGNADGMYNLARCYTISKTHDYQKMAFSLYKKASEYSHTKAENSLACCYYNGFGVVQDYEIAFSYFRKAFEKVFLKSSFSFKNNSCSCNNLGICYEEGKGVPKDLGLSKEFYKKGSMLGNYNAISNLGFILWKENKKKEAIQKFNIAYSNGSVDASYQLGMIYEKGCNDGKGFVLQSNREMAMRYYFDAIQAGHVKSRLRVGIILLSSTERFENGEKALNYIHDAAKLGCSDAMVLFGRLHVDPDFKFSGHFLDEYRKNQDSKSALEWFKKAVRMGNSTALFYAGELYERDAELMDLSLAIKTYTQAAILGSKQATKRLQDMIDLGLIEDYDVEVK